MTQIPQDAINAATNAVITRHGQLEARGATVIPYDMPELRADVVAALEAAEPHIAAAERQRLLDAITQCKTVLVWPANGYLADAVPYAQIRDLFAGQIPSDPAAAERQRIRQLEAALEIATTTLHRLALIDEIAGMGQRDHDPELKARCRKAQLALDGIADLLDDPAEPAGADGVSLIAAERKRQIAKEGWTAEHDAAHNNGVLARAGACYAWYAATGYQLAPLDIWPWRVESWKPGDHPVRTLAKAGALIAAEIDRLTGPQPASAGAEPGEHGTTSTNEPAEHEL